MTKEEVLKTIDLALDHKEGLGTYNITLPTVFKFIKDCGKHDFFVTSEISGYSLYIKLYNSEGYFFDNKLWGTYSSMKTILKICRNIIEQLKLTDETIIDN